MIIISPYHVCLHTTYGYQQWIGMSIDKRLLWGRTTWKKAKEHGDVTGKMEEYYEIIAYDE